MLVEIVQHDLGDGVAFDLHDDPQAHPVAGLVLDIGDARKLAFAHLIGDRGNEVVVVDLIRQLGDDNAGSAAGVFFDLDHTAHPDRPTAGGVSVDDTGGADD